MTRKEKLIYKNIRAYKDHFFYPGGMYLYKRPIPRPGIKVDEDFNENEKVDS